MWFLRGSEDEDEFSELGNGMRLIMAPQPRRPLVARGHGWPRKLRCGAAEVVEGRLSHAVLVVMLKKPKLHLQSWLNRLTRT